MAVTAPAAPSTNRLHQRLSIEKMTASQVTALRQAYAAAMALDDDRGFAHFAGIHGLPLPMYCQHHTSPDPMQRKLFLPWHRAYLYFFELALQDRVTDVSLPWWDWTSPNSHSSGIPAAYAAETADDGSPNPLASGPISSLARQQFARLAGGDAPDRSFRQPHDPPTLPSPAAVEDALSRGDFFDFSEAVEELHDGVHVWIGGTVAEIPLAAFDPLFFAHHAMIDRIWAIWQIRHHAVGPPEGLLPHALPPFQMTVAETLSVSRLGYQYASFAASVSPGG